MRKIVYISLAIVPMLIMTIGSSKVVRIRGGFLRINGNWVKIKNN